jgi:hypothetical protein
MDAKELNETTTRLYERLRELSQEKLSKPITVKRKKGDEKSRGFGISNYRDLLWLPVGTLLYADADYYMKKNIDTWVSTFHERLLTTKELFTVFVSLAADDFPIYFIHIPNTDEGV